MSLVHIAKGASLSTGERVSLLSDEVQELLRQAGCKLRITAGRRDARNVGLVIPGQGTQWFEVIGDALEEARHHARATLDLER